LTGVQALRSIDETRKGVPGTIDFMRHKIKHVVYYMVENRSFDHVCGWLYENEKIPHLIGPDGPFKGIKHAQEQGRDYNIDPFTKEKVKVSTDGPDIAKFDPYHDMTDTMRQCFFMREHPFDNRDGYAKGTEPDMGGFVWNNGDKAVMSTCKPEQLPVLNGLARAFAVSDEWFCSMPGATDAQRAFALTGSALGELNNFMSGPEYSNWPYASHRGSIWKVLWANGFDDWKIYNSVEWNQFVLTYHLFLKGQIPTVDAETSAYLADNAPTSKYIGSIDQFMKDAKNGNLPAFSFLEPVWIEGGGSNKPATSYHPLGRSGAGSAEKALNDIYEALKAGKWNETLLIITFDEHGGFFDHVPPPRAKNPWPHDTRDGFRYDLMGVRVPTILVSPWIEEGTVFRSEEVPYDSTSIMATLLRWYGIPRARWGLGERTHHAPTFENVFQCTSPRTDAPLIKPREEVCAFPERPSELHQQVIPRLISAICGEKVSGHESRKIADDILLHSASLTELNVQITELAKQMRRKGGR
jgi:phospholipase C